MLHVELLKKEKGCSNNKGTVVKSSPYPIYAGPHHYQPVFILSQPIDIPGNFWDEMPYKSEYPIRLQSNYRAQPKALILM